MERRSFIRLTSLTSIGLLAGGNLFASTFKNTNHELIEIEAPTIHVRHGSFNIQPSNQNKINIQRDIFNANGLEQLSENRMVSIKVTNNNSSTFGVLGNKNIKSNDEKLVSIKLSQNNSKSVKVTSPSIIFSEYDEISVNGIILKKNQAYIQYVNSEISLLSKRNQAVLIYKLNDQ